MTHERSRIRIMLLAAARPNFMKVAPLYKVLLADDSFELALVHTGQHYDDNMSGTFLRELGLPDPNHHLEVGSGSHAQQTADVMKRLEPVLISEKPAALIVVGDVNSTLAGALTAAKLHIPVVHAEAGLRSFDRSMPEEINRIATDSVSDLLLITEESARTNLLHEGKTPDQIAFVGNLMIDSLRVQLARALASNVRERLGITEAHIGLVTLHRPSNVDDPRQLDEILSALEVISGELPLYWPVHPRTRSRLNTETAPLPSSIHLLDPLGYSDFLYLQANCAAVLTDSGGIQEESTVLGVPCLTLRDNTERPVTVESGTNYLAGTSAHRILETWRESRSHPKPGTIPPLWDGQAAARSHAAIKQFLLTRERLGQRRS